MQGEWLNGLGLDDLLNAISLEPRALDVYTGGSKPGADGTGPADARPLRGRLMRSLHRRSGRALYRACRRFANIDITFGVTRWINR